MRLAFSQATPTGEADVMMTRFREHGYAGLQLKPNQYAPYLQDPREFTARYGALPGVASALITGGALDDAGVRMLKQVIAFAAAVGSERVVFCHAHPRAQVRADDYPVFANILNAVGEIAHDQGVSLSLHHHFDQPVMHRADFVAFFAAADIRHVGLTIDTAHLVKSGVTEIADVIRDWAHVIDNFHLKDIDQRGQFRVLGEGLIDFAPVFAAIRSIGYAGWVSADEESGADSLAAMRTCHAFLTAGLGSG